MEKIQKWGACLIIFSLFLISTAEKERSPASTKEIIGKYTTESFAQTCFLKRTNSKGKSNYCSASLVKSNKLITAAHCYEEQSETIVACSCGIDPQTQKEIIATAKVIGESRYPHPRFVLSKKELSAYDIQIFTTETEINCPDQNIKPFELPTSIEHAKDLIENKMCYFSGAGIDQENQYGHFHTVRTPKNFRYRQGGAAEDPAEWISYLNVTSAKIIHSETNGPGPDPAKFSASEIDEYERLVGVFQEQKKEILEKIINDDPEFSGNTYANGDSGGSLVCLDNDKRYLIGVLVNVRQDATLINDPAIWNWLKDLL